MGGRWLNLVSTFLGVLAGRRVAALAALGLVLCATAARGQVFAPTCTGSTFDTCCILEQPGSISACPSDLYSTRRLRARLKGLGLEDDYYYIQWRWYKRGINGAPDVLVPGAEGYGYTAELVEMQGWQPWNNGQYRCEFFESVTPEAYLRCGFATSQWGTYTAYYKAQIVQDPVSQTACGGTSVTLSVEAINATIYEWHWTPSSDGGMQVLHDGPNQNGTIIQGATTATLVLTGVEAADSGSYSCLVSAPGPCGTDTSSAAVVSIVAGLPVVQACPNPSTINICRGGTASYEVTATGQNLTYQWYKHYTNPVQDVPLSDSMNLDNSTVISGANTATLTLSNCGRQAAGTYTCKVSNFCGAAPMCTVTLTTPTTFDIDNMLVAPQHLCSTWNQVDRQFYIDCIASTTPPGGTLYYRWYKQTGANWVAMSNGTLSGGTVVAGATTSQLHLTNVHTSDAGNYRCRVSSISGLPVGCGTVDSIPKTVAVTTGAPTITAPPSLFQVCALGQDATFTIGATGALTYSWFGPGSVSLTDGTLPSGTIIEGGTTSTLRVRNVHAGDVGIYQANVLNDCGAVAASASLLIAPAPTITLQPVQPGQGCAGTTATLRVNAPAGNLSFQWMHNGVPVVTGGDFTVTNFSDHSTLDIVRSANTMNSAYACTVSNQCGSVTTNVVFLNVMSNPITFAGQPLPATVCAGSNVAFSAAPNFPGPFTYQWQKGTTNINNGTLANGTVVSGATTSVLGLAGVDAADAGNYRCRVTNPCGTVNSASAALVVNTPPTFTGQPLPAVTACPGGPASFSVVVAGTPAPTLQWRRNLVNINGATGATLTIPAASVADEGLYDCIATNQCGSMGSNPSTLTVNATPAQITLQPVGLTRCVGGGVAATFTVAATGNPSVTYQWRKNTANISGATSASYTIASPVAGSAGSYDCVVTTLCGSVISDPAALTMINGVPVVTVNPVSRTVCEGGTVSFSVTATGSGLSYVWRNGNNGLVTDGVKANGTIVSGATTSTITFTNFHDADVATNHHAVVTNACGSDNSSAASITAYLPPSITVQPQARTVCLGSPATFSVTATGTPAPTYQWIKDGSDIPGATAPSYTIGVTTAGSAGSYSCRVSNTCATVFSDAVSLTLAEPMAINAQPMAQSVCTGATAALSISATGSNLTYRWQVQGSGGGFQDLTDGSGVSGAATNSLTLAGVQASAGVVTYRCVVTSVECGSLTSEAVTVTAQECGCSPADVATEGSADPLSGPDGFITGIDFDVFVQAYYTELRRVNNDLVADLTDGTGTGGPDGFVTGTDFDRFVQLYFQGC